MYHPGLKEELKLARRGYKRIAGVDEAGVGPLAGPVVAAAVILPAKLKKKNEKLKMFRGVRDSKKLSERQRENFYKLIVHHPHITYSVASVSAGVIDKIRIRRATECAMLRCIRKLHPKPDFVIYDGSRLVSKTLKARSYKLIVKADEKVLSCALASIIAKVTRDRFMKRAHKIYPHWRFDIHKGYGTRLHFQEIKRYGSSVLHRLSFHPVRRLVSFDGTAQRTNT